MRLPLAPSLVAVPLTLASCSDSVGTDCTLELRVQYQPPDTTIIVGQSFTASVALSSCGGREKLSDNFAWHAQDSAVVVVDAVAGRVTGRAPGETRVDATGAYYGPVGSLRAAVLPEAP